MPAFLNELDLFMGTGEKNEDGKDLTEFLEDYNPNEYETPSVSADILVFQYNEERIFEGLKLLMIKRKNHPCIGAWALPGGFVNMREDIDIAAKRELAEETGLRDIAMEQLYCFGGVKRDPRTRIVTVAYLALVKEGLTLKAGDDAADALWLSVFFTKEGEEKIAGSRKYQNYKIELTSEENGFKLSAVVEKSENIEGLLREVKYKTLLNEGIAFDHPCFIVKALMYLQNI